LLGWSGEIVLVGVNYDKKTKQHECVIERISGKTSDKFPINRKISDKTSDKLRKIIARMQENNGTITQVEVASMFGVTDRQARNYLDVLVEQGHVIRLGANKDRTYRLKK
jgi:predicted HTH transcriptional regulator